MNNKWIKGDGGIIGLTENKVALERWLDCSPEINRYCEKILDNHENNDSFPAQFRLDLNSLCKSLESLEAHSRTRQMT